MLIKHLNGVNQEEIIWLKKRLATECEINDLGKLREIFPWDRCCSIKKGHIYLSKKYVLDLQRKCEC